MELSKRIKLLKILVYVYLVVLSLIGLSQILIGGTLLWDHVTFNKIAKNSFGEPAAMMIGLGLFAQILCWFGWSSTTKKNQCRLIAFNVLLLALLALQITVVVWAIKQRHGLIPRSMDLEKQIDDSFESFLNKHFKYESMHSWNRIQEEYRCCGVDGPADYRRGAAGFPWSCCSDSVDPYITVCSNIYQRGCLVVIINYIKKLLLYAALTAFIAATFQTVGLFCSIQLIFTLKRSEIVRQVDTSSISFRQKLERELKPLADRTRAQRQQKIDETVPETVQSI